MKLKLMRRLFVMAMAFAVLALLALACDEEEEEAPTPTPPVEETPTEIATPTEEPTPMALRPGAAGIPSNPREVRGLEGILTLDDGLAIWEERPANEDRTGVTDDTILIGGSGDLTGPIAAYVVGGSKQSDEVFKRINEAGGIHGRKLASVQRDDKNRPDVAVQVWKELVESDEVFILNGTSGTVIIAAIVDYLKANNVPAIGSGTGATRFCEPTNSLMFCGTSVTPLLIQGMFMAQWALGEKPDAKIAVIYDNNDFGASMLEGTQVVVPESQIVAEIAFEVGTPDVTPMVDEAVNSGADYLFLQSTSAAFSGVKILRETFGSDMKVGVIWSTVTLPVVRGVIGSENADGLVEVSPFLPPESTDPASTKWIELLTEETDIGTTHVWQAGALSTEMLVRALEMAGPDLTREGLIDALEIGFSADDNWKCSVCVGPIILGPQDHWAFETVQGYRWSDAQQQLEVVGEPLSFETSEGRGIRGSVPGYECSAELPCPWKEGS
jgi:branched-chain amino acid transport system substrate-binding protein